MKKTATQSHHCDLSGSRLPGLSTSHQKSSKCAMLNTLNKNSGNTTAKFNAWESVLVQPEMEKLARSFSEYSAIYGEPICTAQGNSG
jgi:hypothetical protein